MQHRLNIDLLLNLNTERERTHADACRGAIGHIDGISADGLGMAGAFDLFLRHKAARRINLDTDHEVAVAQFLQERRWRHLLGNRIVMGAFGHLLLHRNDFQRLWSIPVLLGQMVIQRSAHGACVHGRGAAATTDQPGILGQEERHMAGKIFGAGRIVETPFHPLRETGIGHHAKTGVGRRFVHGRQCFQHLCWPDATVGAHQIDAIGQQPFSDKLR